MKNCCGSECLITPPKGFVPPEGTSAGKSFDLVCTFEPAEDGKLKLTVLGDTPMDSGDDKDGDEAAASKPDYSEYSKGMMSDMAGGQAQGQMA